MSISSPHSAAASAAADVPSAYAKKALFGSAIGYAMDGFDLLILGFMLGAIRNEFGLSGPQAGLLFTFTLLGAVTGGIV
ncbi:MAG: hypothetical protein ACREED_04400, partial [Stellaceae bacterium]